METLHVVVGLGNLGKQYDRTRHNVGFEVVDVLSENHSIPISKAKHKGLLGEGKIAGKKVILLKPQTYMNLSGESVREILEFYKLEPSKLIIVYDDIDVLPGEIKVRSKGSGGTHNGMRSILYHLQTDAFPRVRIGIGKPHGQMDLADFVLSKFKADEIKLMQEVISKAASAIECMIGEGVESAMNRFNAKK